MDKHGRLAAICSLTPCSPNGFLFENSRSGRLQGKMARRLYESGIPIGSMYGIYANIGGILMVNVTIYIYIYI